MNGRRWIVAGAARLTGKKIQTLRKDLSCEANAWKALLREASALPGFPPADFENFRRADEKTKACILVSCAAYMDAGSIPEPETAFLHFGREGCHEQNRRYFDDYVRFGRNLGQGHLFVSALPTTPLSEAAISMKLHGPAYYFDSLGRMDALWNAVDLHLSDGTMKAVLVCRFVGSTAHAFLAQRSDSDSTGEPWRILEDWMEEQ